MDKETYTEYIQEIFDSQNNMLIVNDGVNMTNANKTFFQFFSEYANLEEFAQKHHCVCEFYEKIDGYVYDFDDKNWIEYVLENPHKVHKAKIKRGEKIYVFQIKISKLEKFKQFIISLTDITDTELYKEGLEESNKLLTEYKKAVDASAIVSKTDINGKITYVNRRFIDISGYSKEELIGKSHNIIRHPDMPKDLFDNLWNTIKSKEIWQGQMKNRKKDGSHYVVDAIIAPILDRNDNIVEFIAMRTDITDIVKAKDIAQQAEATKTAFLANMSHEIRTPLNAILGYTKILNSMDTLPSKAARYIHTIDSSTETLLSIVNDILDISKLESNSINLEKVDFNPIYTFEESAELFSAKAKEKHIDFKIDIDPKIPLCIKADLHKLKQIISNLISNAIKFTPQKGEVSFRLSLMEKNAQSLKLQVAVKDNGIGISQSEQEKILKPFTQANENINRSFGGTGLGLSISNKMLEFMGSSLNIESTKGEGSLFWFDIIVENCEDEYNLKQKFSNASLALFTKKAHREKETLRLQKYLQYVSELHTIDNVKDIISEAHNVLILFEDDIHLLDLNITESPIILITDQDSVIKSYEKKVYILPLDFNASQLYDTLSKAYNLNDNTKKIATKDLDLSLQGKVLLVEDHPVNRELFSAIIDQKGDIECTMATNGLEALQILDTKLFDIIFMDINMPVMDGTTAFKKLRESGIKTPVIALTANAIAGDKEKFLTLGFDDYLSKPIEDNAFNEILQRYLQSSKPEHPKFNVEKISKELHIQKDVYLKIVNSFFKMVFEDVEAIENAIQKNNLQKIYLGAHKIKGSAGNLRIDSVSSIAKEIEENALKEIVDFDYTTALERLRETIYLFKEDLK